MSCDICKNLYFWLGYYLLQGCCVDLLEVDKCKIAKQFEVVESPFRASSEVALRLKTETKGNSYENAEATYDCRSDMRARVDAPSGLRERHA